MSTRFSLDQPMDIDEFKRLSLKAFDDYEKKTKEIPQKIKELKEQKRQTISDNENRSNDEIFKEAEKKSLKRRKIAVSIVIPIFLSPLLLLFILLNFLAEIPEMAELISKLPEMVTFGYGAYASVAAFLLISGLIAWWWLWGVFGDDDGFWKWVAGIFLFVPPVCWWAAFNSIILYIVFKLNDKYRISRSLEKKKHNRKKLRKAKVADQEATARRNQNIDAEIARLEREANKEGEYEWLYREWVNAFENDEQYQYWVDWADRVVTGGYGGRNNLHYRDCIDEGPEKSLPMFRRKEGGYWGIVYNNNNETPRRFIEITVDVAARSAKIWYEGSLRYKTNHL